jgi:seryl-tRNA synthetase
MIDVNKILKDKKAVIHGLVKRNIDFTNEINTVYDLETEKRTLKIMTDDLRHEFNVLNKTNNKEDIPRKIELKQTIKKNDILIEENQKEIFDILIKIPNMLHEDVPEGTTYEDNKVLFQKEFTHDTDKVLEHWDIAEKFNLINFKAGAKIAGNGFPVYVNKGARLQRAIINFCLDEAGKYGFVEHQVPIMVNKDCVFATGQYPDKEGQMYHVEKDDLYLVPTAEIPLTNIYRNTVINKEDLPILITGYTPCFRREAGAYGKDTRGLNRLHQFDKVELVCITTQEDGYKRLELMLEYIQTLLDKLKLTYRVLALCGDEMTFTGAKAYDIETWCPAQEKWLEVVTVTNFDTFQANRLNCKYKEEGVNKLVHTLNGTGLALPRLVATILETYQTEEGVIVPEVLREYTGFDIM